MALHAYTATIRAVEAVALRDDQNVLSSSSSVTRVGSQPTTSVVISLIQAWTEARTTCLSLHRTTTTTTSSVVAELPPSALLVLAGYGVPQHKIESVASSSCHALLSLSSSFPKHGSTTTTMFRWTVSLLYLIEKVLIADECSSSELLVAVTRHVIEKSTCFAPLHSRSLQRKYERQQQESSSSKKITAAGGLHFRVATASIRPLGSHSPLLVRALATSRIVSLSDNFRVSLQEFDPAVIRERLSRAAATTTGTLPIPLSPSMSVAPLIDALLQVHRRSAVHFVPVAWVNEVAEWTTTLMVATLEKYASRFSSVVHWLPAGVLVRDVLRVLAMLPPSTSTGGDAVEESGWREVHQIWSLLFDRVTDHIEDVLEGIHKIYATTRSTNSESLCTPLVIEILVQVWEPAVALFAQTGSCWSPLEDQAINHFSATLFHVVVTLVVAKLGGRGSQDDSSVKGKKKAVDIAVAAQAVVQINEFEQYVVRDARIPVGLRSTLAATIASVR